ncbi:MAG: hypothetical protein ACK5KT_07070 [Dysgonomonas sp.]
MLLLCFCTSLVAQNDSINTLPKSIVESRSVDVRIPDKDKIEEYKKDSRFDYAKNKHQGAEISFWDRLWYDISQFIGNLFGSVADSGALSFVVIAVSILVVCLLLMKLLGIDYRTVLGKKKIDTPEIDIYTENVHEMNFDALISNALQT